MLEHDDQGEPRMDANKSETTWEFTISKESVNGGTESKIPENKSGNGNGDGNERRKHKISEYLLQNEDALYIQDEDGWIIPPNEVEMETIRRRLKANRAKLRGGDPEGEISDDDPAPKPITIVVQNLVNAKKSGQPQTGDRRCFRKNFVKGFEKWNNMPVSFIQKDINEKTVSSDARSDDEEHVSQDQTIDEDYGEEQYEENGTFADEFAVPILPTSGGGR